MLVPTDSVYYANESYVDSSPEVPFRHPRGYRWVSAMHNTIPAPRFPFLSCKTATINPVFDTIAD
jgi:hypothetical protein